MTFSQVGRCGAFRGQLNHGIERDLHFGCPLAYEVTRLSFSCSRERTCDVSKMLIYAVSLQGDNSLFFAQEVD
jgi:hypothetical protein